jgi:hypothetical protein
LGVWILKSRMKLHGLLQKCSFFFRFDWTLAARGGAHMKLHIVETVNRLNVEHRTSNIERPIWNRSRSADACAACCSALFKTDRIHYSMLDVERSMFNVHLVSHLIKLAVILAGGAALNLES